MADPKALRTVYLGQFIHERADKIAGRLEEAGIAWNYKQSGGITRFFFAGDWGVRLFVAADRVEEARAIVAELAKGEETT